MLTERKEILKVYPGMAGFINHILHSEGTASPLYEGNNPPVVIILRSQKTGAAGRVSQSAS